MGLSIKDFPDSEKHIDTLIKLFSNQGWNFDVLRPEIVFSDEVIPLPENKNGLHGYGVLNDKTKQDDYYDVSYLLSDYKKSENEVPKITIYSKVLQETAIRLEYISRYSMFDKVLVDKRKLLHFLQNNGITTDSGMDYEKSRENLFYCALLNETAKWILADVVDANGNTWKESPLDKKDHLHECLTALFTHWVVKLTNNSKFTVTFNWVFNKLHNGNYSKYNDFINDDEGEIIKCTEIARVENFEFVEMFKLYVELISGGKINFKSYKQVIETDSECQDIISEHWSNCYDEKVKPIILDLMSDVTKHNHRGAINLGPFGVR